MSLKITNLILKLHLPGHIELTLPPQLTSYTGSIDLSQHIQFLNVGDSLSVCIHGLTNTVESL